MIALLRMLMVLLAAWAAGAAPAFAQSALDLVRNRMVDEEIVAAGVANPRVIKSMRAVPRHEFVPINQRNQAYLDMALPIGESQTISPPFIVAYMTEQLDPQPTDKVLEIGTGSGYQAAVLSGLVAEVYSIEIVAPLGRQAAKTLKRLGYDNVFTKIGDGYQGWPEHAPFDKIIVTCSPEHIPQALIDQLREGGRMVIPVGERYQQIMYLLTKHGGQMETEALKPTFFVPMTGRAEDQRRVKPDPAKPTVHNGDFEETIEKTGELVGWHYQRQLTLGSQAAPFGKQYATFSNSDPGRNAHMLQGMPVDGRLVKRLRISAHVRADNVRPGSTAQQAPVVLVVFYDERRAEAGRAIMGPWRGTFDWQPQSTTVDVPLRAREGLIGVGLFGATGEISFDKLEIAAVP